VIHDEADAEGIWDAPHNLAAVVEVAAGDVAEGFAESQVVVETTCETQYAQHAPLEPHVCQSYLDDNGRLVLYTSTQVPFHLRRIIARVLDLPIRRIRVVKPRIGGGFGSNRKYCSRTCAPWSPCAPADPPGGSTRGKRSSSPPAPAIPSASG